MQQDALIFYAQHCQVFFYLFESYQCKGEAEGKEKPKIDTNYPPTYTKSSITEFVSKDTDVNNCL